MTAEAQPGFEMTGYPDGGWSLTIVAAPVFEEVTPAALVAAAEEFVSPGVEKPGIDTSSRRRASITSSAAHRPPALCRSPGLLPGDGAAAGLLQAGRTARLDARSRGNRPDRLRHGSRSVEDEPDGVRPRVRHDPESTGAHYELDGEPVLAGNHNVAPGTHTVALPQFDMCSTERRAGA